VTESSSGAVAVKSAKKRRTSGASVEGVDHAAREDLRPQRMQAVLERGDDPEVPAAAAQAPEQVRVLLGAGRHALAVGGDDLGAEQVVARRPVLARDPAESAAEGETGHAGERHVAGGRGEAEGLRRAVDVAEQRARAHARRPRDGVHLDGSLGREVDHDARVAHRVARNVVAPAAHGEGQAVLASEAHRSDDVVAVRAASDERRPPVDHAVPDAPRRVVLPVAGPDQDAGEIAVQRPDGCLIEHGASPSRSPDRP